MRNKTFFIVVLAAMLLVTACADTAIDRHALVMRNNPHVTKIDSLHSLTVGNGRFAFPADATGLQTFPEYYKEGLSLGTYSEWGWHSFPNKEDYKIVETLQDHPLPDCPARAASIDAFNASRLVCPVISIIRLTASLIDRIAWFVSSI